MSSRYPGDPRSVASGTSASQQPTRSRILAVVIVVAVVGAALTGYQFWHGRYLSGILIFLFTGLFNWIIRVVSGDRALQKQQYEKAEYGVPHCRFKQTAEGFTVSFRRLPEKIRGMMAINNKGGTGAEAVGAGIAALVSLLLGFIFGALYMIFGGTKIEVTKDAVLIRDNVIVKKRLNRADFVGFSVDHTVRIPSEGTFAVLAYSYGRRR